MILTGDLERGDGRGYKYFISHRNLIPLFLSGFLESLASVLLRRSRNIIIVINLSDMSTIFHLCGVLLIASIVDAATFTMTPSQFVNVQVGSPFSLTWTGASGPVTLLLKNGISTDLKTVETIASMFTPISHLVVCQVLLTIGKAA